MGTPVPRLARWLALSALSLAVAVCGGKPHHEPPDPPEPPVPQRYAVALDYRVSVPERLPADLAPLLDTALGRMLRWLGLTPPQVVGTYCVPRVRAALQARLDKLGAGRNAVVRRQEHHLHVYFLPPARALAPALKRLMRAQAALRFQIVDAACPAHARIVRLVDRLGRGGAGVDTAVRRLLQVQGKGGWTWRPELAPLRDAQARHEPLYGQRPGGTTSEEFLQIPATASDALSRLIRVLQQSPAAKAYHLPDNRELRVGSVDESHLGGRFSKPRVRTYCLHRPADVSGIHLAAARVNEDRDGRPIVMLELTREGADRFLRLSRENLKRRLAVVLDTRVLLAPVIHSEIPGGKVQITFGPRKSVKVLHEATRLASILKADRCQRFVTLEGESTR